MAIYHLSVKPISRAHGRSATAAAAYRSCSLIRDERTADVHDYTRKRGLEHAEIVLPTKAAKRDINWARNRQALWNAAEMAEKRRDSRVAREYEVAVPYELTKAQRVELVRAFSQDLANRYGVAVDFAIHKPHRAGDTRNTHAHILTTTREITATGMGAKISIELGDRDRAKLGLDAAAEEITRTRVRWAEMSNRALEKAQVNERVDHRSLKDQGIEREPTHHWGPAIAGLLERGKRSTVADRWHQEANERLRLAKEAGELEREHAQLHAQVINLSNDLAAATRERRQMKTRTLTPAELREKARAEWLELRNNPDKLKGKGKSHGLDAGEEGDSGKTKNKGHSRDGPDDDFSM
jgi:ATP-dependent exoDNAse (exonuclease V) alpha subunit